MKTTGYPTIVLDANTYWKSEFMDEVEAELQDKSLLVKEGFESFSKADILAYHILKENGYFDIDEETINE